MEKKKYSKWGLEPPSSDIQGFHSANCDHLVIARNNVAFIHAAVIRIPGVNLKGASNQGNTVLGHIKFYTNESASISHFTNPRIYKKPDDNRWVKI